MDIQRTFFFSITKECCRDVPCTRGLLVCSRVFLLLSSLKTKLLGCRITYLRLGQILPNCFSKWLEQSALLLVYQTPTFCTLPTRLGIIRLFHHHPNLKGMKWNVFQFTSPLVLIQVFQNDLKQHCPHCPIELSVVVEIFSLSQVSLYFTQSSK